ncbi:type IV toxin-antitoxin system AbiEi family antitoxin domain-containing protein [Caballeronia sp. M23-90]
MPGHESFHQTDMLMEGLSNLAPRRLQALLDRCQSVKVKLRSVGIRGRQRVKQRFYSNGIAA